MADSVFGVFTWSVHEGGYRWARAAATGKGEPEWVLTSGISIASLVGPAPRARFYHPLDDRGATTALYRNFVDIDPEDRDALLSFANEYGDLGLDDADTLPVADGLGMIGEPWSAWKKAHLELQRAAAVWAMPVDDLRRHIRWEQESWHFHSHPDELDAWRKGAPKREWTHERIDVDARLLTPGDVRMPARFLLIKWVTAGLASSVSPRLAYDVDTGRLALEVAPRSLLGAMWLQLARAIDGNIEPRQCKECGRWFQVGREEHGNAARLRTFCSTACKQRDFRKRKDLARALHAAGKPLKEIASAVDSTITTVRKWVSNRKG
jgi:endogenous inhibitor of DNA gyrase (YacG/DUF329 family)